LPGILGQAREIAERYGIGRIWTTEMGYDAYAPMEAHMPVRARARTHLADLVNTERTQADRLTRAALYSLATTFERFYDFNFQAVSPYNGMLQPWGMTRANHLRTPRPVLAALSVANRMLAGTTDRQELDFTTPGLWGVRFSGEDRRVDVLWSDNGPQDIPLHLAGGRQVRDIMGNPIEGNGRDEAWVSLGKSPLYVVGPSESPVSFDEGLAVRWDEEAVWSGGDFRGEVVLDGVATGRPSIVSLTLREGPEGPVRWQSADLAEAGSSGERAIAWEFPLEADPGPIEMILEAELANGRTVRRRFIPMVLGQQEDRVQYETGDPLLVEDFSHGTEVSEHEWESDRGIRWSGHMFFPWFNRYGPHVERRLRVEDGAARLTVLEDRGKPGRNRPNWPTVDCTFDETRNWLAYKGLKITYRMDRETEAGDPALAPDLSSEGIGVRMGDADGNVFFTSAGHTGLEYYRDGDWFVALLSFEDTLGLNEKRARMKWLQLWSVVPADDDRPFGYTIRRIEAVPALDRERPRTDALPEQPVFDE
jgi:hypothetical protein